MAIPIIMPRQGQSVESCIIGEWHKKVGDPVKAGDTLFTYETDKATFDETAKDDGTLIAIFYEEGDDVPCLLNVCVIGDPSEDPSPYSPHGAAQPSTETTTTDTAPANTAAAPVATIAQASPTGASAEAPISPRAQALADKTHADLSQALPTGPKGRIIERDVEQLIADGRLSTAAAAGTYAPGTVGTGVGGRITVTDTVAPAPAASTAASTAATTPPPGEESYTQKHSNIRKVIAKSMHSSLTAMAQLTMNTSFDATDILLFREKLKKAAAAGLCAENGFPMAETIPTINDIIVYATARVLLRYRECNAHYDDEKMTFFHHVHMGVATDTPRGLMVPTVRNADTMSLVELSRAIKSVVGACREGSVSPDLLTGGTFTITNMGTLGIESFTPVINPPQTCILGVNTLATKIRMKGDAVEPYQAIGLSLTFDHRALDGSPAGRFLKDLVRTLENFSLML